VRMRSRNPWVFARRRLLGWKVRLLTYGLQGGGSAAGFLGRTNAPYRRRDRPPPVRGGRTHDQSTVRNGGRRGQTGCGEVRPSRGCGRCVGRCTVPVRRLPPPVSPQVPHVSGEKDENRPEDRPHGPWATDAQPVDCRVDNGRCHGERRGHGEERARA
jgi:hypothetical protein